MPTYDTHPQASIRGLGVIVDALDVRVDTLESGGGGSDPWTYVKLGNDQTVSVTANTAVTDLVFTPAANQTYEVELRLLLQTSVTTTGPRPGIAWPGGTTNGASEITVPNSNTALALP